MELEIQLGEAKRPEPAPEHEDDRRLMGWVTILIDAKLLEQRAQYVDLGDDVYEFDQQGYRAALEAGAFIDPASGREVADTSLLAPYWAVSASLAA